MNATVFEVPTAELEDVRSKALSRIFKSRFLADVTIMNDIDEFQAHKIILSTMSPIFKKIFERSPPQQHTILYLNKAKSKHIKSLIDFIYTGKAEVEVSDINDFVALGTDFRIEGMVEDEVEENEKKHQPQKKLDGPKMTENVGNDSSIPLQNNKDNSFSEPFIASNPIDDFIAEPDAYTFQEPVDVEQKTVKKETEKRRRSKQYLVAKIPGLGSHVARMRTLWIRDNGQFTCKRCDMAFTQKSQVEDHVESHLEFRYQCNSCMITITSYKTIKKHDCLDDEFKDKLREKMGMGIQQSTNATPEKTEEEGKVVSVMESSPKPTSSVKSEAIIPLQDEEKRKLQQEMLQKYTKNELINAKHKFFATDEYFVTYQNRCEASFQRISNNVWTCKLCDKLSKNKSHAMEHAEFHLSGKFLWKCFCNRVFYRRYNVRLHLPCVEFVQHYEGTLIQPSASESGYLIVDETKTTGDDTIKNGKINPINFQEPPPGPIQLREMQVTDVEDYEIQIDKYLSKSDSDWLCSSETCSTLTFINKETVMTHIEATHLDHIMFTCDGCPETFERHVKYRKHTKSCSNEKKSNQPMLTLSS